MPSKNRKKEAKKWRCFKSIAAIVNAPHKKRKNMTYRRGECRPPERIKSLLMNGKTEMVSNLQPQQMEKPWIDSLAAVKAVAAAAPPKMVRKQPTATYLFKSTREMLLTMNKSMIQNYLAKSEKTKQKKGWLKTYERSLSSSETLIRGNPTYEEEILIAKLHIITETKSTPKIAHAWGITTQEVKAYAKKYKMLSKRDENASVGEVHAGNLEEDQNNV